MGLDSEDGGSSAEMSCKGAASVLLLGEECEEPSSGREAVASAVESFGGGGGGGVGV